MSGPHLNVEFYQISTTSLWWDQQPRARPASFTWNLTQMYADCKRSWLCFTQTVWERQLRQLQFKKNKFLQLCTLVGSMSINDIFAGKQLSFCPFVYHHGEFLETLSRALLELVAIKSVRTVNIRTSFWIVWYFNEQELILQTWNT